MSVIQQVYLADSGCSNLYKRNNYMGLLGFDRRLQIIRTCRAQSL